LGSLGVPVLAVDLREALKDEKAAAWLDQFPATRSIGAVYNQSAPASFLSHMRPQDGFDVVLFVNKTTAARANHWQN
jgi:erythromycin esterase-like protein